MQIKSYNQECVEPVQLFHCPRRPVIAGPELASVGQSRAPNDARRCNMEQRDGLSIHPSVCHSSTLEQMQLFLPSVAKCTLPYIYYGRNADPFPSDVQRAATDAPAYREVRAGQV